MRRSTVAQEDEDLKNNNEDKKIRLRQSENFTDLNKLKPVATPNPETVATMAHEYSFDNRKDKIKGEIAKRGDTRGS